MKVNVVTIIICFLSLTIWAQNYQDNFANDPLGDFPSHWDVVRGMATVDQQDGYKFVNFMHGGIIKPIINEQVNNYLDSDFTIEFDIFYGETSSIYGQRLELRLWDGTSVYRQDDILYQPFIIKRNGLETGWSNPQSGTAKNFLKELETLDPVWRHVKVECKSGKLKIYLDQRLVLNFPRFNMQPTMVSLGGMINDSYNEAKVGFTNFSIVGLVSGSQTTNTTTETRTEGEILATDDDRKPEISDINNTTNSGPESTSTVNTGVQQTGQISRTIDQPLGTTEEGTINKDSIKIYKPLDPVQIPEGEILELEIQEPLEPIDATTTPQLTQMEIDLPSRLKITVTDLLCIVERDGPYNPDDYALQLFSYFKDSSATYDRFFEYDNNIDCNRAVPGGDLLVCGDMDHQIHVDKGNTRIGNFTNTSLYYGLDNGHYTMDEVEDIKFFIWLKEYTGNKDKVLFDGSIQIKITELLNHLLNGKFPANTNLVQYYDTSITALSDFFEYGPRGSYMWLRFTSRKTLEGPIRLGNNIDGKAAVWVEFELLD